MNRALLFLIIIFFISCSNKNTLVYEKTDILSLDKILNDTDIIILDVRTSEEINAGYIPNSTFIDYYDKNFENKINLIDRSKKIYTLCKSGGRSVKAAEILSKNGFRNVYNLEGGFMRWKANKMSYDIVMMWMWYIIIQVSIFRQIFWTIPRTFLFIGTKKVNWFHILIILFIIIYVICLCLFYEHITIICLIFYFQRMKKVWEK
mgnify:CR=1 FL=1